MRKLDARRLESEDAWLCTRGVGGQIDKQITYAAPAIPEIWSNNAELKGSTVKGVLDVWNDDWNLSFSSPQ